MGEVLAGKTSTSVGYSICNKNFLILRSRNFGTTRIILAMYWTYRFHGSFDLAVLYSNGNRGIRISYEMIRLLAEMIIYTIHIYQLET